MFDSIYDVKLLLNHTFDEKKLRFCHYVHSVVMDVIT